MDFITNTRREKADRYNQLIKEMGIDFIKLPHVPDGYFHTYQSYVCVLDAEKLGFAKDDVEKTSKMRNEMMGMLESKGIATRVGTHANHMLGHYKTRYGFKPTDLKVSYMLDKLSITLPLYVQMTDQDQVDVLQSLAEAKNSLM